MQAVVDKADLLDFDRDSAIGDDLYDLTESDDVLRGSFAVFQNDNRQTFDDTAYNRTTSHQIYGCVSKAGLAVDTPQTIVVREHSSFQVSFLTAMPGSSPTSEPRPKLVQMDIGSTKNSRNQNPAPFMDAVFWPPLWRKVYEDRVTHSAIQDGIEIYQNTLHCFGHPIDRGANRSVDKNANDTTFDSYLSHGSGGTGPSPLHQNLGRLFDKYRDQPTTSPDKILINGIQNYMNDLNVAPDEVVSLALFQIASCRVFGEIERAPFIAGWSSQPGSADTKDKQKGRIEALRKELPKNRELFTKVYRFSFNLLKPDGQRNIPVDSAMDVWKMFFTLGKRGREGGVQWKTSSTDWLAWWLEFYGSKVNRPVNKDLWNMVAELAFKTMEPRGDNLAWWSEDAAWPGAIDEFVQWARERKGLPPAGAGDGETGDSMDIS